MDVFTAHGAMEFREPSGTGRKKNLRSTHPTPTTLESHPSNSHSPPTLTLCPPPHHAHTHVDIHVHTDNITPPPGCTNVNPITEECRLRMP